MPADQRKPTWMPAFAGITKSSRRGRPGKSFLSCAEGAKARLPLAIQEIVTGDAHGIGHAVVEIVQADHVDDIQNIAVIEAVGAQGVDIIFACRRRRNGQLTA